LDFDDRFKAARATPAFPHMMDLPLVPIFGPRGSNQLVTAMNALDTEA